MRRGNWFKEQRINWILEMIEIYEYINRIHIQRKFGVSVVQASQDLRDTMRRYPGKMEYDIAEKRYRLSNGGK